MLAMSLRRNISVKARRFLRALAALAAVVALLAALSLAAGEWLLRRPFDTAPYLRVRASGEMVDRNGRLLYAFLNPDEQWCFERGLDDFSPWLIQATVAAEDQRYYAHHGVDLWAIGRAATQNLFGGRVVSGASTITMQVVKLTQGDTRSVAGKLRQAWNALRLERNASKQAILRSYLNNAPYGMNLIGAEAAARRYFGAPASELTLAEAALLAALPKAPGGCMPLAHPRRARARRDYVLGRMLAEGFITRDQYGRAVADPVAARWHEYPQLAPHLAMRLRDAIKTEGCVRVTLDGVVQARIEDMLSRALNRFEGDVTNAAAVVVDAASATLLARVGSADFFHTPGGGQVDLCAAARSPGSALKPFLYALAIDRDVLYPPEMLLDDTMDFGSYNPGNFDGEYRGLISATEALRLSLNVPALIVQHRVGAAPFQRFLCGLGLNTLTKAPEQYGLGLTLGNCEVRLEELAGAYAALANLGEYRPISYPAGAAPRTATRVLSRGAALALYTMLEQPFPVEPREGLVRARGAQPRVCWKTGTSTGYHDAWAFAFNRQYVVGVWVGNNTGKSSRRLVGAQAALPIAARVFRVLPALNTPAWPALDADVRRVVICAVTGLPAGEHCPNTREGLVARKQYLHRRCDVHRPGADGGTAARWPGSSIGWDLARVRTPDAAQAHAGTRQNLQILSPTDRGKYVLTGEARGDLVRLSASTGGEEPLHWYVDGRYLGESSGTATPMNWKLEPGTHVVACMNNDGETDEVRFEVVPPRPFLDLKKGV